MQKLFLDACQGIFVVHSSIFFQHLVNQEGIFKLIVYWLTTFILYDGLYTAERTCCKITQEDFVIFNGCVDQFTNDVAEESGVGLAEFFNVKLVPVEGLDFFIVFLRDYFTEFMQEDILSLADRLCLHSDEFLDRDTWISALRQTQQMTPLLEIDFPGMQN